jgi:hypothetical protein
LGFCLFFYSFFLYHQLRNMAVSRAFSDACVLGYLLSRVGFFLGVDFFQIPFFFCFSYQDLSLLPAFTSALATALATMLLDYFFSPLNRHRPFL